MVKKYKVILTPRAQSSLRRITNYLRETASNAVAQKVRKGILETVKSLKTFPYSHEVIEEMSTEQVIYRKVLKWSYKIVFTIQEEELEVIVFQIYHGAQGPDEVKKLMD